MTCRPFVAPIEPAPWDEPDPTTRPASFDYPTDCRWVNASNKATSDDSNLAMNGREPLVQDHNSVNF
ncbi:hypothetical protein DAPPUDRAFT_251957 [Daphnia pulex]|uniref:Uncharacterized protein n=1 Tax=Daphnia pulex TaxID=6669 RepID=E9H1B7_DAPPU|nr:hypothetical protein DAPPUDRAFT_251957 [Daphnia pulex]|eukprot:EFX74448.1 hypothetical protein DAPPUDRAFT_251957 [Daphnia pulex]